MQSFALLGRFRRASTTLPSSAPLAEDAESTQRSSTHSLTAITVIVFMPYYAPPIITSSSTGATLVALSAMPLGEHDALGATRAVCWGSNGGRGTPQPLGEVERTREERNELVRCDSVSGRQG